MVAVSCTQILRTLWSSQCSAAVSLCSDILLLYLHLFLSLLTCKQLFQDTLWKRSVQPFFDPVPCQFCRGGQAVLGLHLLWNGYPTCFPPRPFLEKATPLCFHHSLILCSFTQKPKFFSKAWHVCIPVYPGACGHGAACSALRGYATWTEPNTVGIWPRNPKDGEGWSTNRSLKGNSGT